MDQQPLHPVFSVATVLLLALAVVGALLATGMLS